MKLSYKNPLFQQIFHDFHKFLKMIPNKSSLFNKIPTVPDRLKKLLFGLKTKISPKILLLPLIFFFFARIRIRNKIPGSGSVKNESGSATLEETHSVFGT